MKKQFARQSSASSKGRRLTADAVEEIRRRLNLGETLVAIAQAVGCSENTVAYHREKMIDGHPIRRALGRDDISGELARERRARREAREQKSADRQLRAHRARQAALAALRELIPGYDGVAHGRVGMAWPATPRRAL